MDLTRFYEDTQRVSNPDEFLKNFKNCEVLSTVSQEEDEAQWVANRSKGIGGSDIGTICGVNPYSTARLLYFKKTGQFEDSAVMGFSEESKERMSWGHKLEPIVADEYMKRTGNKIVICPATLRHRDYPWALANVDRVIVDDEGKPTGILEVKTANARLLKDWEEGDVPMSYIYQLNWYLWITDLQYGAFAALIGGNKFVMIEVYRNDELLKDMITAGDTFWNHNVKNLIEPDVSGSKADGEFIKELFGDVERNQEITLDDEDNDLANFIVDTKKQIKDLEKQANEATHKLQLKMKNNEFGYTTDHVIKWTFVKQTRVDTDKLKTEFPEVYSKCLKRSGYRRFTVK